MQLPTKLNRSCGTCIFFLWGCVKGKVFVPSKSKTLEELKLTSLGRYNLGREHGYNRGRGVTASGNRIECLYEYEVLRICLLFVYFFPNEMLLIIKTGVRNPGGTFKMAPETGHAVISSIRHWISLATHNCILLHLY